MTEGLLFASLPQVNFYRYPFRLEIKTVPGTTDSSHLRSVVKQRVNQRTSTRTLNQNTVNADLSFPKTGTFLYHTIRNILIPFKIENEIFDILM
jgi:hypothetical protein